MKNEPEKPTLVSVSVSNRSHTYQIDIRSPRLQRFPSSLSRRVRSPRLGDRTATYFSDFRRARLRVEHLKDLFILLDCKTSFMSYGNVSKSEKSARYVLNKRARSGNFQFHRLPPDIIYGVLSRLRFKEAARTSMVSRQWRRLWRCYPKLVFTRDTMLNGTITDDYSTHILATFIRRVNSVVWQLKSATLKKFVVIFPLLQTEAHHIDRWISLSATSRARRIILDLCPETENMDKNDMYCFPLHLFPSDNCVKSLCLGFVSLTLPSSLTGFTNLKKLGLHMVSIRGDLQCLLPKCDVLEWLSLTQCSLQDLTICQPLHRLQYLRVQHCRLQKLYVRAPNLTEFELTDYPIPIVLGECLNLSKAAIMLLSSSDCFNYVSAELPRVLCHLQDRLSVNMTIRTEMQRLSAGIARFNNLKHLILNLDVQGCTDTGNGIIRLASLLELAPMLEVLELNMYCRGIPIYIGQLDKPCPPCLHTHLRSVLMTGFYGIRGQLELAMHILMSANALEHLTIDPEVKVAWGPCLDWSQQRLMYFGRLEAGHFLRRGEYRHMVTVL